MKQSIMAEVEDSSFTFGSVLIGSEPFSLQMENTNGGLRLAFVSEVENLEYYPSYVVKVSREGVLTFERRSSVPDPGKTISGRRVARQFLQEDISTGARQWREEKPYQSVNRRMVTVDLGLVKSEGKIG